MTKEEGGSMPFDDDSNDTASTSREPAGQRSDPAEAFAALSDSLRVDILRNLHAHHKSTGETVVGFAELRKRVGVRDSGRFRYHLNKLCNHFVKKSENGYQLRHAGIQIVAAIFAGTYTDNISIGPAELDSDCPFCKQSALATYEDGHCFVTCANDHPLFQWSVPPNAIADMNFSEIVSLAELLAFQAIEQALTGICPRCYDPIETAVTTEGSRPTFQAVCDTCGGQIVGPISFCLIVDPDVAAFCRRQGFSLRADHVWEFPFVSDDSAATVIEENPIRIEFTISLNDETLDATVDEQGHVIGINPPAEM